MLSPNVNIGGGHSWPEVVRSADDAYGYGAAWYKRRPSPGALTRMVETWGWINEHPVESDRKLLYAWAWQKTKSGRFLNDFASREGINSRTLRRTITRICQAIADDLAQRKVACIDPAVDDVSEIEPEIAPSKVASQSHANFEMAPDAKPKHDPNSPEIKALIKRLEKANRRRVKSARPSR